MLTELVLDSNPITDKGILLLSDFIAGNPARLRVLKLSNLWSDITTPVMNVFLAALEKNTQITNLSMDTRLIQHRDIISKVCERNWKRFAKMRKLQKTLLGEIKNNPKLANPRGITPATVGEEQVPVETNVESTTNTENVENGDEKTQTD
ncbi:hypothetical protein RFI_27250 [Reticulomyxa filosa]|uniref:Uncharacterized protein n=1 Tax=Reticulomyxa filosa TaxID=46433 RepID=X6M9H1_RETFI|nr:hypothetical protein RFI_27250 [Reticulomyxa filosa]|eukprot:ETO10127.1 hypothetical protein RFI_27250 [Reticulomyxa filosa]